MTAWMRFVFLGLRIRSFTNRFRNSCRAAKLVSNGQLDTSWFGFWFGSFRAGARVKGGVDLAVGRCSSRHSHGRNWQVCDGCARSRARQMSSFQTCGPASHGEVWSVWGVFDLGPDSEVI